MGRASVAPIFEEAEQQVAAGEPEPEDWADPLDRPDEVDLTQITIDLRTTMVEDPAETYYQRFSSRVPGHE